MLKKWKLKVNLWKDLTSKIHFLVSTHTDGRVLEAVRTTRFTWAEAANTVEVNK